MVIVFQVYRCTTWLALFKKDVLHKLHIQVSLPLLKLTREIRLYKEKRNLIHIDAIAIFNLSKISFKRISSVECPCGINLNAFNWCDKLVLYNYMFLVDMDILLSFILTMLFFFFRHWWLLSKPVSKQRDMYRRSEWLQLHLRAWLCRKELLK